MSSTFKKLKIDEFSNVDNQGLKIIGHETIKKSLITSIEFNLRKRRKK